MTLSASDAEANRFISRPALAPGWPGCHWDLRLYLFISCHPPLANNRCFLKTEFSQLDISEEILARCAALAYNLQSELSET